MRGRERDEEGKSSWLSHCCHSDVLDAVRTLMSQRETFKSFNVKSYHAIIIYHSTHTHTHTHTHACTPHTYTHMHTDTHLYVHTHSYAYGHTRIHTTHIHSYTHHTHTRICTTHTLNIIPDRIDMKITAWRS